MSNLDKLIDELVKLHASSMGGPPEAYRLGFRHGHIHALDLHHGTPCEQIRHDYEINAIIFAAENFMRNASLGPSTVAYEESIDELRKAIAESK